MQPAAPQGEHVHPGGDLTRAFGAAEGLIAGSGEAGDPRGRVAGEAAGALAGFRVSCECFPGGVVLTGTGLGGRGRPQR